MNINDFLLSNGAIPTVKEGDPTPIFHDPDNLLLSLHENEPNKMLKEFGFFTDKKINHTELQYTKKYIINKDEMSGTYLFNRTFISNKDVINNEVKLLDNDTSNCPIYQIIVTDENDNIIDISEYSVSISMEWDKIIDVPLQKDGYLSEEMRTIYEAFGGNKPSFYNKFDTKACIYNNYTKHILFTFHNEKYTKVKITTYNYDLYTYAGFFKHGWDFIG